MKLQKRNQNETSDVLKNGGQTSGVDGLVLTFTLTSDLYMAYKSRHDRTSLRTTALPTHSHTHIHAQTGPAD